MAFSPHYYSDNFYQEDLGDDSELDPFHLEHLVSEQENLDEEHLLHPIGFEQLAPEENIEENQYPILFEPFDGASQSVVNASFYPYANARSHAIRKATTIYFSSLGVVTPAAIKSAFLNQFSLLFPSEDLHPEALPTFYFMSGTNKKSTIRLNTLRNKIGNSSGKSALEIKVIVENISFQQHHDHLKTREIAVVAEITDDMLRDKWSNYSAAEEHWKTWGVWISQGNASVDAIPIELFHYFTEIESEQPEIDDAFIRQTATAASQWLAIEYDKLIASCYDTMVTFKKLASE
ncbi:hypothetical protein RCL1_001307 [Eukaryota sp. TZLM3-RCL]